MAAFAQVNPARVATQMQYDYCAAYLDMFSDEPRKVRSIIAKYANHPVDRWRNAFAAIANQLDEFDGKAPKLADKDDQAQQQAKLAAKEAELRVRRRRQDDQPDLEERRDGPHQLLPDGRGTALQPQPVRAAIGQPVLADPAQRDRRNTSCRTSRTSWPSRCRRTWPTRMCWSRSWPTARRARQPVLANAMSVTLNENYGQLQVTGRGQRQAAGQGLREDLCALAERHGEVPQGRLHRPARQVRLRLGQHARTRRASSSSASWC